MSFLGKLKKIFLKTDKDYFYYGKIDKNKRNDLVKYIDENNLLMYTGINDNDLYFKNSIKEELENHNIEDYLI